MTSLAEFNKHTDRLNGEIQVALALAKTECLCLYYTSMRGLIEFSEAI